MTSTRPRRDRPAPTVRPSPLRRRVLGPGSLANAAAGCEELARLRAQREDVERFLAADRRARLTPPDAA